ncbi:MAG: hypothetical protein RLZZ165_708 [Bacteroidota bacterium]
MRKYIRAVLICLLGGASLAANAQLERANRRYDRREYYRAIPLYQRYLEKSPTSNEGMEKIANCYRMTHDSKNAEHWYNRLIKAGNKDPRNVLYYAQTLINNEKWEDAVPLLESYLQVHEWDEVAQNTLQSAQNYKKLLADSTLYMVKGTNVNTPQSESCPAIYRNALVFSSSRTPAKRIFGRNQENFHNLYQAQYSGKSDVGEPRLLPGVINSKRHESGSTFSRDGNTIYFTRNAAPKGKFSGGESDMMRLRILRAELIRNKWRHLAEVPFNGKDYSAGYPSMSPDGNTFYFVSDMPGGEGATDIWMSRKQGETWSQPENMGAKINTPGNEMFPWISPTGVFYFASDGHPGLGGLDLFRVTSLGGEFERIHNMGAPINSPKDDFAIAIDEATQTGFFSSNRKGGKGEDDIYSFVHRQILKGQVFDAKTSMPVNNAKVEIYGVKGLVAVLRSDSAGLFRCGLDRNSQYKLVGSGENYLAAEQVVSTVSFDPSIPIETSIRLTKNQTYPGYTLKGKVEADTAANLSGTKVRITAKEVITTVDKNGAFEYQLSPETDYEVRVEKEGFLGKVMEISTKGMKPGELDLHAMLNRILPDTALYRIYYDYNDVRLNTDAIRELDRTLEFLKQNPSAKIRLVSHSDSRGEAAYNEQLSRQRTNNATAYLIEHGIDKSRLQQVWLGEHSPQNKCPDGVPCSEEEYRQNRQTEIQLAENIREKETPKLETSSINTPPKGSSKPSVETKINPNSTVTDLAKTSGMDSKAAINTTEPAKATGSAVKPAEQPKTAVPATKATEPESPKSAVNPAEQPKTVVPATKATEPEAPKSTVKPAEQPKTVVPATKATEPEAPKSAVNPAEQPKTVVPATKATEPESPKSAVKPAEQPKTAVPATKATEPESPKSAVKPAEQPKTAVPATKTTEPAVKPAEQPKAPAVKPTEPEIKSSSQPWNNSLVPSTKAKPKKTKK